MSYLLLRYNLKDGVSAEEFEKWVKEVDQPTMRGVSRVASFDTWKVTGLLIGEGAPQQSYFEIFEITDLAGFGSEDMAGEVVQGIMGAFMGYVENPEFSIAEKL